MPNVKCTPDFGSEYSQLCLCDCIWNPLPDLVFAYLGCV
jgi:hypothetical protein